jgi:hypothetical protein
MTFFILFFRFLEEKIENVQKKTRISGFLLLKFFLSLRSLGIICGWEEGFGWNFLGSLDTFIDDFWI